MKDIQNKWLKTKIYPSVSKLLRPNRKFTAILEQNCKSEYGSVCSKDYVGVLTKKTPHLNALYCVNCTAWGEYKCSPFTASSSSLEDAAPL